MIVIKTGDVYTSRYRELTFIAPTRRGAINGLAKLIWSQPKRQK